MESKFWKIGTLFTALGCASIYPSCMAQTSGNGAQGAAPHTTLEYASAAPPDGRPAAPSLQPAADPAPEVRTEVAPGTAVSGTDIRPALTKELEAMKQRIAELEAEIRSSGATAADAATALQGAKKSGNTRSAASGRPARRRPRGSTGQPP